MVEITCKTKQDKERPKRIDDPIFQWDDTNVECLSKLARPGDVGRSRTVSAKQGVFPGRREGGGVQKRSAAGRFSGKGMFWFSPPAILIFRARFTHATLYYIHIRQVVVMPVSRYFRLARPPGKAWLIGCLLQNILLVLFLF